MSSLARDFSKDLGWSAADHMADRALLPDPRTKAAANTGATFDAAPDIGNAELAKKTGRLNAAQTTPEEESKWRETRKSLLAKHMAGEELTRGEKARLQYARWNLGRIEDARVGPYLDELEAAISSYEQFASEVDKLRKDLDAAARRR